MAERISAMAEAAVAHLHTVLQAARRSKPAEVLDVMSAEVRAEEAGNAACHLCDRHFGMHTLHAGFKSVGGVHFGAHPHVQGP